MRRRRSTGDFSSEIQSHLDLEIDRLIADGLTPDAARLAARKTFGSVAAAEERYYESTRTLWLDHLRQDLRVAARSVARYPVAAIVAVVSLAFGIGAMTTTLMVRDVVFRRPPPLYAHPADLSLVLVNRPDRPGGLYPYEATVPGTVYNAWRDGALAGITVGAATPGRPRDVRIGEQTESVRVRAASPDLFTVLGVGAAIGRTFADAPAQPGGLTPAILSRRVWYGLFQDRPDAIGSTIWIDGAPHTVVGVMPDRFWFGEMNATIWIPFQPERLTADDLLLVVARRPEGMRHASLAAALQPALDAHVARLPASERQRRVVTRGVAGTPLGASVTMLLPYVLAASVALTLFIACANVAILMIAQWTAREHEIAIRASLGASRARIVRALLTESVLLATAGGALGIATTFALRGVIVFRAGVNLARFDLSIDPWLFVQSAVVTLASGLAAGIVPALYETRRLHNNPLNALASSDRVRQRWRHALVIAEITVTIALLVELGGMINGYQRTIAADMGFDRQPLLSAVVENSGGVHVAAMVEIAARQPGVAAAAAATGVPFMGAGIAQRVRADGVAAADVTTDRVATTPGLFATLGVPLLGGRDFVTTDSAAFRVAIVNESLAKALFPGGNAIGGRVRFADGATADVVGMVGDYSTSQFQPRHAAPKLFVPIALDGTEVKRVQLVVRASGDPAPLVQPLRRELRRSLAGTLVGSAFTYEEITTVGAQEMLVGTAPLVPLIAIGMLLTTAGIYGVLAFAIARRSRELAVRVAIGATGRDLVRLVSAHSLRLVLLGTACGIGLTFALSRIVRASGGAGSVYDPDWPSFVIPVAILMVIGIAATWIPSRRAMRINPAVVLRNS
ncbi:MAG TPA: ABC transporter permease [Vicinamibacterales bacterium]|nr:ABC transporter permease [Vicinamibacterales bacterium]